MSPAVDAARVVCRAWSTVCYRRMSVRPSVCLSVPSIDSSSGGRQVAAKRLTGKRYRSIAAGAAYQPLNDICCRRRRSAANAGSVVLRAEGRGSTQTC